jgi:hypothetical protein
MEGDMAKVVINAEYGGFGLSSRAEVRYAELGGKHDPRDFRYDRGLRSDPILVRVVEELAEEADGAFSGLAVVEVPEGAYYRIREYDGLESVELRDEIEWMVG